MRDLKKNNQVHTHRASVTHIDGLLTKKYKISIFYSVMLDRSDRFIAKYIFIYSLQRNKLARFLANQMPSFFFFHRKFERSWLWPIDRLFKHYLNLSFCTSVFALSVCLVFTFILLFTVMSVTFSLSLGNSIKSVTHIGRKFARPFLFLNVYT